MAIIHQHDKRSGITYVYDSKSYWDKEKKMTRAKRKLIGRLDGETGEIIPTDGRGRKGKAEVEKHDSPDYETLYKKLLSKNTAQETLIVALQKELKELKGSK